MAWSMFVVMPVILIGGNRRALLAGLIRIVCRILSVQRAGRNGEDSYRGGDGPVATCGGNNMKFNPLYQAFIEAGHEAGYPTTNDYNGNNRKVLALCT
jgi:choline dehydrogenase-like flavoprotein